MSSEHPTIADIQTAELVYYDPDYVAQCYQFCQDRDIDCLPEIGDSNTYYQRIDEEKSFKEQTISEDRKLDGATFLFRPDLLDRFKSHAVQFVYADGEISGVVHYSDYNKDVVSTYLYGQIARYERDLRELAALCGLTNKDMLDHFQKMGTKACKKGNERFCKEFEAKKAKYEAEKEELTRLPEFQSFYLMDLIGLANRRKIIRLDDRVHKLRNQIMHGSLPVQMEDAHTPDYIYRIESFTEFFKFTQILLKDSKRISNRLAIKHELT